MPLTPDQMAEYATKVIRSAVEDIEFISIGEVLEDDLTELAINAPTQYDEAINQIDDAIRSATVTVAWHPDAGSDH